MLAKDLREGAQLLQSDGSVLYVITKLWADHFSENGSTTPIVGASVRYNDGGTGERVFSLDVRVPHVLPAVA